MAPLFSDAVFATGMAYADCGSMANAGAGEGRITAAAPSATAPATRPPIAHPTTVFKHVSELLCWPDRPSRDVLSVLRGEIALDSGTIRGPAGAEDSRMRTPRPSLGANDAGEFVFGAHHRWGPEAKNARCEQPCVGSRHLRAGHIDAARPVGNPFRVEAVWRQRALNNQRSGEGGRTR